MQMAQYCVVALSNTCLKTKNKSISINSTTNAINLFYMPYINSVPEIKY